VKITINIDAIGESLDSLVEKQLIEHDLPKCFGNMVPPILLRIMSMEDTEILKPRGSVTIDQIAVEHIDELVIGTEAKEQIKNTDLVLIKDAEEEINEYKKNRAAKYVNQLVDCASCPCVDVCDKLTKNYLKFIEIEGQYKKRRS